MNEFIIQTKQDFLNSAFWWQRAWRCVMGGGAAILFFLFLGSATFCGLFCPVISPSTKAPRSAAGGWMGRRTKSDVWCCGLVVALGSLPGVEDLVKTPANHPCSYCTFHQLIPKLVFFVASVSCAVKPTECFGAVTIRLVRVWSWAAVTGGGVSYERSNVMSHLKEKH